MLKFVYFKGISCKSAIIAALILLVISAEGCKKKQGDALIKENEALFDTTGLMAQNDSLRKLFLKYEKTFRGGKWHGSLYDKIYGDASLSMDIDYRDDSLSGTAIIVAPDEEHSNKYELKVQGKISNDSIMFYLFGVGRRTNAIDTIFFDGKWFTQGGQFPQMHQAAWGMYSSRNYFSPSGGVWRLFGPE